MKKRTPPALSASAIEDAWQRMATATAIESARAVVSGGAVPPMTPIGRLSDTEWGWIIASVLFGWIATRAAQATNNGVGAEGLIRATGLDPDPWDAGAIAAILPELARPEVDWSKPLVDFTRDEMIDFLGDAFALISKATKARDEGEGLVARKLSQPTDEMTDWGQAIPL